MTAAPLPPEGTVVEVFVQGHGPRLGIVSNIPPARHVLRVTGKPLNGATDFMRVQDADGTVDDPGITRLYAGTPFTVLADTSEAGWGSLR